MRTIESIDQDILELSEQARRLDKYMEEKAYNKLLKQIQRLRFCRMYLESNPNEPFIESEIVRLDKLVKRLEEQFPAWSDDLPSELNGDRTKAKAWYNKEMGILKMKKEMAMLRFILKNN